MSIDSAVFFPMPDYAKDLGFFPAAESGIIFRMRLFFTTNPFK